MKFTNHEAASYIKTVALMKSSSQQLRKFSFLNEMAQHCSSNDYLKLVNKYHTFPPQKNYEDTYTKIHSDMFYLPCCFEDALSKARKSMSVIARVDQRLMNHPSCCWWT